MVIPPACSRQGLCGNVLYQPLDSSFRWNDEGVLFWLYIQRLKAISADKDWNGWIAFFLKAIIKQSSDNANRVKRIMNLYDIMKQKIQDITHSQYNLRLLDSLFSKPIFRTSDLVRQLNQDYGIHQKTTPALLRQLREAGVLLELRAGSGRRAAILCFPELLNVAEGQEVSE